MKRSLLFALSAFLTLATPLLTASGTRPDPSPRQDASDYDSRTLEQAWEAIAKKKSKKAKFKKAFLARVEALDTVQLSRVRALVAEAGEPEEAGDPPFFDPKTHVKSQPIRRKALKAKDKNYQQHLRVLGKIENDGLRPAYIYDWHARAVVRIDDPEDPDRIFHNALSGMPPGFDLARAQALKELDRGHDEALLKAFANTYTDRDGKLYPNITLYDTYGSGMVMEMPDIDTLGIIHVVLNDWETWTDPVSGTEQKSLYTRIGKLFNEARSYREPRESAVDCLLSADPIPRKGYHSLHGNFQALWAANDYDVAKVGDILPDSEGWERYIKKWVKRCKDQATWDKGLDYRKELEESEKALRAALVDALREAKALE